MKRKSAVGVAFALLLGLASGIAAAEEVEGALAFALRGTLRDTQNLAQLTAVVPAAEVRVFEPYEGKPIVFHAMPFDRVLDAVYGTRWRSEEEVLLTCRDGYQPGFPVQRLLDHRAWLAFRRSGASSFSILKHESGAQRRVDLSPFYLVWENLEDPVVMREGDYGWPYQLVGVDLIRARDRFPNMTPAEDATAAVRAGFAAFRKHCSRCHTVNGEGGKIGPELNAGPGLLATRGAAWLRAWIDDPSQLAPTARMPALDRALEDRKRTIDEILAYLAAMARKHASVAPEAS